MPRHTAHAIRISYHEKRKHNAPAMDLNDLPGGGTFFDLACEAWTCLPERDEERSRSFQASPPLKRGRTALLVGRAGHYGSPAQVRDVSSGEIKLQHDGELANEPKVRLVLAVPPTRPCLSAYMVIEEVQEGTLKAPFIQALRELWDQRLRGFTLSIENVAEAEGWLATAEMAQVKVTYRDQQADLADHGEGVIAGTVTSVLKPPKGRLFSRRTYDVLRKQPALVGRLVGRDETETPDSVTVTMVSTAGQERREKTFAIGSEKTPLCRWVFSDHGMPALEDAAHLRRSLDEVRDLYQREGVEWDTAWEKD